MLMTIYGYSQSTQQDTTFGDQYPYTPARPGKFGGALGITPVMLYPDYGPINEVLRTANAGELSSGPIVTVGGQIYGYILFVQNLRFGYQWGSGSKSTSLLVVGNPDTRREVELSARYSGFNVEYVIPVANRLDLTVGGLLGWGGIDLTMNRDNGSLKDWNQLWSGFGGQGSASEFTRKMSGSFFIYYPSANLEYAVFRWLGVRAGVGYMGMSGGSWKLDDKYDIDNVPGSVSGKGVTINTGIFVGTFIF